MILRDPWQSDSHGYLRALPDPILHTYSARWLQTYGALNLKRSSIKAYNESLANHILPVLGHLPLSEIKRYMVIDLIRELRKKNLSRNSIRLVYATLRVILNNAVDDELIVTNPGLKVGRFVKGKVQAGASITALTREDLHIFLQTIKEKFPPYYPLFLTFARTGLRLGEALGLQWQDINFDERVIYVRRTLGLYGIDVPKNGKSRRVDMSKQLASVLIENLQATTIEASKRGWKEPSPWVFCSSYGTPLDPNNLRRRVFYKAIEAARLKRFRIHDLRHTFATLLIQNGESLVYLKDQLGHHSIQITVDIYGHLICGTNKQAVDRLDEFVM
jgi:integrase